MTKKTSLGIQADKAKWTTPVVVDLDADHSEIAAAPPGGPNGDGGAGSNFPYVFTS